MVSKKAKSESLEQWFSRILAEDQQTVEYWREAAEIERDELRIVLAQRDALANALRRIRDDDEIDENEAALIAYRVLDEIKKEG